MNLTLFLSHCLVSVTALAYRMECPDTFGSSLPPEGQPTAYRSSFLYGEAESSSTTESNWRLLKEEDAIQVYVKENPNGYLSVRMTLNIRGSAESLRERLRNVDGYTVVPRLPDSRNPVIHRWSIGLLRMFLFPSKTENLP